MKNIVIILSAAILLTNCGPRNSPKSSLAEAWDSVNDPNRLSQDQYEVNFDILPSEGSLESLPWSDDYWPTYTGGISHRWQLLDFSYDLLNSESLKGAETATLSPAEKYDLFVGRLDFPLTRSERKRTQILKTVEGSFDFDPDFEIPHWEGLCHGWAAAAVNYKEPKPVTLKGATGDAVLFTSADIKALLTYYQQYPGNQTARSTMVSRRCNVSFEELQEKVDSGEMTREQMNEQMESIECRDVNAGSFHVVLTNEIGLRKTSFIIDVTRDAEVWNQPVNSFQSVYENLRGVDANAANGTRREVKVRTEMMYTVEINPETERVATAEKKASYQYILELDRNNNIIGGRWISKDRPDFLWKETRAKFRGYFKALEKIYNESI